MDKTFNFLKKVDTLLQKSPWTTPLLKQAGNETFQEGEYFGAAVQIAQGFCAFPK